MNKIKKLLIPFISLFAVSLSSCSVFDAILDKINEPKDGSNNSGSTKEKEYKDSFVDTEGVLTHTTLDSKSETLLIGDTHQFRFSMYDDGEEPDFTHTFSGDSFRWGSDDESIASINQNGLVTAIKAGQTRIYCSPFSSIRTYATVTVIDRVLESITIQNPRTTYLINKEFVPQFTLIANYVGGASEPVEATEIDHSDVDTTHIGRYEVRVSYTLKGVTKSSSYFVNVIENASYEPKSLDYTMSDLSLHSFNGWFTPNKGNVKGLVIPVWFTDSDRFIDSAKKTKIPTDAYKAFYGEGNAETGWNSVKSYYASASQGKLNLTGSVSEWFNCGKATTEITSATAINDLVNDAYAWYFTNHTDEDPKDYDSDSNGYFDSLNLLFGCPDEANGNSLFWGCIRFNTAIKPKTSTENGLRHHMWASTEDLYTDVSHSEVDTHVFIHETGHTFGLSDYYDYSENDYRAIAGGTMMFHNTHQQDPYSCLSLGWGKAIVPETDCVVELDDFQSSHNMVILSPNPTGFNSPFDEYIVLELYAPNGLNKFDSTNPWRGYYSLGAQNPGIRIWHVDARLATYEGGEYKLLGSTNPIASSSRLAFTNSWGENHGTLLGREYDDFCELFEIRNSKTISYKPTKDDEDLMFKDSSLFHAGDTFSLSEFSNQFVNGTKLNSGLDLNWTVSIESIGAVGGGYKAVIQLTNE